MHNEEITSISPFVHISSPKLENGFLLNVVLDVYTKSQQTNILFICYQSHITPTLHKA
jgi:hypothetical protein